MFFQLYYIAFYLNTSSFNYGDELIMMKIQSDPLVGHVLDIK